MVRFTKNSMRTIKVVHDFYINVDQIRLFQRETAEKIAPLTEKIERNFVVFGFILLSLFSLQG